MIAPKHLNWDQKRLPFLKRMEKREQYFSQSVDKVRLLDFSLSFTFLLSLTLFFLTSSIFRELGMTIY